MTAEDDLLKRAGQLKGELLDFAERVPKIAKELGVALADHRHETGHSGESARIEVIDHFVLHHKLRDGRSVLEHFVSGHRNLTATERKMLLGWNDDVNGYFVVLDREQDCLVARNLIDELTYRIRSNAGPAAVAGVEPGNFLVGRVVPVGDVWMLSGIHGNLPPSCEAHLIRAAAEAVMEHPRLMRRNPAKVARAWELQRHDRELFVEFFGSDEVVVGGDRVHDEWASYWTWRTAQTQPQVSSSQTLRAASPAPFNLPKDFAEADTIGIIYDEAEGLTFLVDFGTVEAAFADPTFASSRYHRETVVSYLKDETVSALPFRRLGVRYPEGASQLLAQVLRKPGFEWMRDGEKLLRRYKPDATSTAPMPTITVLGDELANALRAG